MWFDVGVVCGKTFDAIGVHRLLTNPHQRLALHLLVERHTTGNHLLPRLRGIAAIREQQHVASILAGNLHGAESVAVTGNVNHLDAAVAKEVEGLLGRPFRTVLFYGL